MGIFNDNSQNDHYGQFKVTERGPERPPGVGFELTKSGNYDIDGKRLTDVAEPVNGKDATTKAYVEKEIPHHPTTHYNLKKSFDFYDDNGVKIDLITDKINGLLSDYNYGYFKIPKSGDDVTFSFCKLLVRNDIEKSTYSALFYFYGFENDTLITGQDLGPILFDVRGVNCNILKYYDDDDSVHTQDHVKGVVWFTNTETNFGFEINLRFFDKSITHFVVLSRCVEGKVNLSFSLNIFNVAHNASLTYFFEDINMNGRKIKVVGSPVDVEDVANKNYVDTENAKQDIAIADKANKSYVDGEIAKVHIDTTPLLPRNGSRSMFGDLDMDGNHILSVENLTDYQIYNPLDLNYRIKDLKSVVNKEYLNVNFLKKINKDGIDYFDLKQITIKNAATVSSGNYDANSLITKAYVDNENAKQDITINSKFDKNGGTMNGDLIMVGDIYMNNHDVVGVKDPTGDTYCANKKYVDNEISKINIDSTPLLPRDGSRTMLGNLDMDNHNIRYCGILLMNSLGVINMNNGNIINLKDPKPSDADHAASVNFVNNTINNSNAIINGVIDTKIKASEERSIKSSQQENAFKKVMDDSLFILEDDDIHQVGVVNKDFYKINQQTYQFKIDYDSSIGYYSTRLGINVVYLPISYYTIVFEMYFSNKIDNDKITIGANSGTLSVNKINTKISSNHTRSVINFYKNMIYPSDDELEIDIALKNKAGESYDVETNIYVIVYGVYGFQNDVSTQLWDRYLYIDDKKIHFEAPIDMVNKDIENVNNLSINQELNMNNRHIKNVRDANQDSDAINLKQLNEKEANVMNHVTTEFGKVNPVLNNNSDLIKFIYRNLIRNDSKSFLIKELYFPDSVEGRTQNNYTYQTNGNNKGDVTFYLTFVHKATTSDNMMIALHWESISPPIQPIYIFVSKDKIVASRNPLINEPSLKSYDIPSYFKGKYLYLWITIQNDLIQINFSGSRAISADHPNLKNNDANLRIIDVSDSPFDIKRALITKNIYDSNSDAYKDVREYEISKGTFVDAS